VPHVELLGSLALDGFHRCFRPRTLNRQDRVLKAAASYLAHDGRSLLVECLTVEGFLRQSFFVLVAGESGRTMVRLLPRTSPEKTVAVKECVVWIASWLRNSAPGELRPGVTNLGDLLEIELPPEAIAL
jgi:hypothetical protein